MDAAGRGGDFCFRRYVKAGADAIFPEALTTEAVLAEFAAAMGSGHLPRVEMDVRELCLSACSVKGSALIQPACP